MSRRPPPPPPGSERRKHARFELVAQIELHRGGEVHLFDVRDISAGGLFVTVGSGYRVMVRPGDRLNVVLDVSEDDGDDSLRLEAETEVIRAMPDGFGLMWLSNSPDFTRKLTRLLELASQD